MHSCAWQSRKQIRNCAVWRLFSSSRCLLAISPGKPYSVAASFTSPPVSYNHAAVSSTAFSFQYASSTSSVPATLVSSSPSYTGFLTPPAPSPVSCAPKHNPFVDQNTFAWGHARVGHSIAELPGKALEAAMETMSEKPSSSRGNSADGHSSLSLSDFFDATTRRCTLCDLPITTTHQAHLGRHEHQARLGVVERSLALMNAFVLDFQRQESEKPRMGSHVSGSTSLASFRRRPVNGLHPQVGSPPLPPAVSENMLFRMSRTPESLLGVDVSLLQQDPSALQNVKMVDILAKKWWETLDRSYDLNAVVGVTPPTTFCRLCHLSSPFSKERRWKLRYLLDWLKFHGILQSSLSIANVNISPEAFSRSQRFEVLEMVGDCVVKVELPDRLTRLFPHGVCSKLALFQRLIDSNSGLLDIYDWLMLDQIIGAKIAHSKAKADVVECIFGELQCFLWATEMSSDPINLYDVHPAKEFQYLRAIVQHTMHELMHSVFMWRLETTLESASGFIYAHGLELLKCQRRSHGSMKKRVVEKDRDRGRYATLPLVTKEKRQHELGHLSDGEMWYRSTHLAVTEAGEHQLWVRRLLPTCMPKPDVFVHRLEAINFLPFVKDVSAIQKRITAVKKALREKPSEYFPSKYALLYPQWRREEEQRAEEQRIQDAVRTALPSLREVQQAIHDQLNALGEPFRRKVSSSELHPHSTNEGNLSGDTKKTTLSTPVPCIPEMTPTPKPSAPTEVQDTTALKEDRKNIYTGPMKELIEAILHG